MNFSNKNLDKRAGSSDWNQNINELTDKQLEYAARRCDLSTIKLKMN